MLKVILIGYGELGKALLEGLLETEHQVVGILSWSRREGLNRSGGSGWRDGLEGLRRKYKIPSIDVKSVNSFEFIEKSTLLEPDIILVGSWGEIFKNFVFSIPKIGFFNCHPSLLPKHRGSNPYASTIIHGEKETGVSFHAIDEGIDTGAVYFQGSFPILTSDTGKTIRLKCAEKAKQLVPEFLELIDSGKASPIEQVEEEASYFPRIKAIDGAINWEDSAEKIHNQVRGLYPWVCSYTVYKKQMVTFRSSKLRTIQEHPVSRGQIIQVHKDSVLVGTSTPGVGLLLGGINIVHMNRLLSRFMLRKILSVGEQFTNAL